MDRRRVVWLGAVVFAGLSGCSGIPRDPAGGAAGSVPGSRVPFLQAHGISSPSPGLARYFPSLPPRAAEAPSVAAEPAAKPTGLRSFSPIARFEARRAAWASRKASTPKAGPTSMPMVSRSAPVRNNLVGVPNPPTLSQSIQVAVHPDEPPAPTPTTALVSTDLRPTPAPPEVNPVPTSSEETPGRRDEAARKVGAGPSEEERTASLVEEPTPTVEEPTTATPETSKDEPKVEDAPATEPVLASEPEAPAPADVADPLAEPVSTPEPTPATAPIAPRAQPVAAPANPDADPVLAGRPRLPLIRHPDTPADLPPATFPRTYYDPNAGPGPAKPVESRSWRPRLFRFWRSEFASSGRDEDRFAQGR